MGTLQQLMRRLRETFQEYKGWRRPRKVTARHSRWSTRLTVEALEERCVPTLSAPTISPIVGTEGIAITLSGDFPDVWSSAPDGSGGTLYHNVVEDSSATVDWGDGSPQESQRLGYSRMDGSQINLKLDHRYTNNGTYTISIDVSQTVASYDLLEGVPYDKVTSDQPFSFATSATINDAPLTGWPAQSGTVGVGQPSSYFFNFTDGNNNATTSDFSAAIDWKDGSPLEKNLTIVQVPSTLGNFFYVECSHTYTEVPMNPATGTPTSVTATATIDDVDGPSTTASFNINVVSVQSVQGSDLGKVHKGQPFSDVPVATFMDSNGTAAGFSATINWGDNTGLDSNTKIVPDPSGNGGFIVEGSHTYGLDAPSGTVSPTVTLATGDGSFSESFPGSIWIMPTPSFINLNAPHITNGQAMTTIRGHLDTSAFGQLVPAGEVVTVTYYMGNIPVTYSPTLDDSDNFSTTFPTSLLGAPGALYQVGFAYAGDDSFTSARSTLTVQGQDISAVVGQQFQGFLASFTDPQPLNPSPHYTGMIDWGDSPCPDFSTSIVPGPNNTFLVEGTHTYSSPGTFSVKVTIADGTNSAMDSSLALVGQNVDVSNWPGYQGEATVAINPKDPQNMIVGSNDVGADPMSGKSTGKIRAYSTIDGGKTWTGDDLGGDSDPVIAFDRTGTAYFAYMSAGTIAVRQSTDDGATWTDPQVVAAAPAGGKFDKPGIAIGPDASNLSQDRIYVAGAI